MIDNNITVKSLAVEIQMSVKHLIQKFYDIGIIKLKDDLISQKEKETLLIYLNNIENKFIKKLTLQKKIHSILNIQNNKGQNKAVKVEIRKKKYFLNNVKTTFNTNNNIKNIIKNKKIKSVNKQNDFIIEKKKQISKTDIHKKNNINLKNKIQNQKNNIISNKIEDKFKINNKKYSFIKNSYNKQNLNKKNKNLNYHMQNNKTTRRKKYYKNNKIDKENRNIYSNIKNITKNKNNLHILYQNFHKPLKNINRDVIINETISITELANKMAVKSSQIIKTMINIGEKKLDINQFLDQETAQLIAEEMGHKVILHHENDLETSLINDRNNINEIPISRAPIVTIMGHVDHGKTTLLDYIRSSKIVSNEIGGITQNIGAYQVKLKNNKSITFIDTPGHSAFTSMRSRGIQITDIIILVVAADDGVMPQTIEAIQHAKAAKVPIIVAINKIDKITSNIENIKNQLSKYNIISESWGGNNIFVNISAILGTGIDDLLNSILLQADILELKAINKGMANGVVIESYLDKGRGPIANILIREGILNKGDIVLCGFQYGRIRGLRNEKGIEVLQAGPSTPIEILGLSGIPFAGENIIVVRNEKQAKEVATYRKNKIRELKIANQQKKFKNVFLELDKNKICELNILLKGNSQGTVEVIKDILINLSNNKINIKIISSGVGSITETDVALALATSNNIMIIGFNVKANNSARNIIKTENIDIRYFSIIYNLIDEIKKSINNVLSPEYKYKLLGSAKVKNIFKITKIGVIAGCTVLKGVIRRNNLIRLIRNNNIIHEGILESLKRFKDNVNEVRNGMECGISIKHYNDICMGDNIEAYENIEIKKK
ncbi:translation initiation factor IF-2 [Enterobacteriaceae endosymbiont of Plateumaris consimilis]|uniref:translation initiation factor IF-2 n=1 Tax=Enterobacteriaceae endosymbiont of Plateumaris consimilis TaxID=2675794 RepID=UPI00144997AD|nr:translation initiation factor IF-2 [Enterobacteriaceae endosymbiont of Plateumaris consimilis]QJC28716.1 translation initiation factor IF-2 [Enterobacteriaceae endosymbiont of Plateumaris consimilis]